MHLLSSEVLLLIIGIWNASVELQLGNPGQAASILVRYLLVLLISFPAITCLLPFAFVGHIILIVLYGLDISQSTLRLCDEIQWSAYVKLFFCSFAIFVCMAGHINAMVDSLLKPTWLKSILGSANAQEKIVIKEWKKAKSCISRILSPSTLLMVEGLTVGYLYTKDEPGYALFMAIAYLSIFLFESFKPLSALVYSFVLHMLLASLYMTCIFFDIKKNWNNRSNIDNLMIALFAFSVHFSLAIKNFSIFMVVRAVEQQEEQQLDEQEQRRRDLSFIYCHAADEFDNWLTGNNQENRGLTLPKIEKNVVFNLNQNNTAVV